MELVRVRFEATVTNEGVLPRFWGPTLRGGLGLAFRSLVCVTHMDECAPCLLRFQCPYPRFFEPSAPPDHPFAARLKEMPRPFALQVSPPSNNPQPFAVGDRLVFGFTIWHQPAFFLPYLIVAAQRALTKGLGRKVTAQLNRVVAIAEDGQETVIYTADKRTVATELPTCLIDRLFTVPPQPVATLTVRFLTPLRIDLKGKLQNPVSFEALVRAAYQRAQALFWAYEGKDLPWDKQALFALAERTVLVGSEQEWLDLTRYSRRQETQLKIGGVMGWLQVEGDDLRPVLPLLRLMEWVQVGKLATMGLGQIAVTTA